PPFGPFQRFAQLVVGHDLDVPADQFGSEADVLTAAADRQGQLVVRYQHDGPAKPRIGEDFGNLGRLKGIRNQHLKGVVPAHDVDAFAVEFLDDVLDAAAANADAGPHRVHLQIDAGHGDFRAITRLAGHRPNVDDSFLDLGNLLFEEGLHEVRVAAREHDLDAVTLLADLEDNGLHPFADVVAFAGNLFASRQKGLALAEGNDGRAGIDARDRADQKLALFAAELVINRVRFRLADLLDHHLLGGLGGDAAERFRVEFEFAVASEDVSGGLIDFHEHAFFDLEVAFGGQLNGGFDAVEDDLARDLLFLVHLVDEFENRLAGVFFFLG